MSTKIYTTKIKPRIPVADGEYLSEPISEQHNRFVFAPPIFYLNNVKVTPTGGTVLIQGGMDQGNDTVWHEFDRGQFNAADSYSSDMIPPNGIDIITRFKITLSGITGADEALFSVKGFK